MQTRVTLYAIDIPVGGEPPGEFRVFKWGTNSTTKGDFILDRDGVEQLMREVARHGIDLMCDWNHRSLEPQTAEDGEATAWYDLEVRDDGLWAVNVRWVDDAAEKLRAKKYRYFSPAFGTDDDGRIVEWINMALTNLPATDKQKPLIAAARRLLERERKRTMKTRKLATTGGHKSLPEHLKAMDMTADELGARCGIKESRMSELMAGKDFPNEEESGQMVKHLAMTEEDLSAYKDAHESAAKAAKDEPDDEPESDEDEPDDKDDDDEEDEPVKKNSRTNELMELTGANSPQAARKAFLTLQQTALEATKVNKQLMTRLEKIENDGKVREVLSLVEAGIRSGRIAKSQKDWAVKIGTRELSDLKELLESSPPRYETLRAVEPEERENFGGPMEKSNIEHVVGLMNKEPGHPGLKVKIDAAKVIERASRQGLRG